MNNSAKKGAQVGTNGKQNSTIWAFCKKVLKLEPLLKKWGKLLILPKQFSSWNQMSHNVKNWPWMRKKCSTWNKSQIVWKMDNSAKKSAQVGTDSQKIWKMNNYAKTNKKKSQILYFFYFFSKKIKHFQIF